MATNALEKKPITPILIEEQFLFPTNEQMVYDTGEDLKLKLKNIITNNKFRR
jgi:hypothetical protein